MIIKINKITNFVTFFQKVKAQDMPFKTSYKLSLLNQEIQKHLVFYQEQFRWLILEYSKKDETGEPMQTEDGQGVLLSQDTMQEAYKKLEELNDLDVELPDIKFSIDDFNNIEISPDEMVAILPFINN